MVWCTIVFCNGSNSRVNYKFSIREASLPPHEDLDGNMFAFNIRDFKPLDHYKGTIWHSKVYWLYLQPGLADTTSIYVLTLNKRFSKITLYPYPYLQSSAQSGLMVPVNQQSLAGVSIILKESNKPYLVKIENHFQSLFKANDIKVQTLEEYLNTQRKNNLFQGYVQGFFWLMLLYNLVLFFIARKMLHLYYVAYILFNALFLLFTSGFSQLYLFPANYRVNLVLLIFQLLGVFFYVLFLRTAMLEHTTTYTPKNDRFLLKPFGFLILAVNVAIGSTVFFRMDLYTWGSTISNVLGTLMAIVLFGCFYRKSDWFMRQIMIGSVILFILGYVNVLYTLLYSQTEFFYTIGLLIELVILTYALNRKHFMDQCEIEYKNREMTNKLETQNRELVNMAMQLGAKVSILETIKEKLEKTGNSETNKTLYNEIVLNSRTTEILWNDFDKHFNETHTDFYKKLFENYPSLTSNEIRLCAFLKLNLNTKEIAMITQHSAHSIETMRSRIRKKLSLDREGSITSTLSRL
jgi:DNA-binding CsgD family transcriptional regulator